MGIKSPSLLEINLFYDFYIDSEVAMVIALYSCRIASCVRSRASVPDLRQTRVKPSHQEAQISMHKAANPLKRQTFENNHTCKSHDATCATSNAQFPDPCNTIIRNNSIPQRLQNTASANAHFWVPMKRSKTNHAATTCSGLACSLPCKRL
jgi:hypothetical protein